MEQLNENRKFIFLERARLAGYKSIYKTDINFNKNINIIIGKNAVGKTNFFTFLSKILNFSYEGLYEFSSRITLMNGKSIDIRAGNSITAKNENNRQTISVGNVITEVVVNNKNEIQLKQASTDFKADLQEKGVVFQVNYISHGIPQDFYFVDKPYSFLINQKGFVDEFYEIAINKSLPYFVRLLSASMLLNLRTSGDGITENNVKFNLEKSFNSLKSLAPHLEKMSPISDLRINSSYNIIYSEEKKTYTLNNLFFEFKIHGEWRPFSDLSDGTKRIFYILADVAFENNLYFTDKTIITGNESTPDRIILIEEPELGIHPHQLHQLMLFLKEQSHRKQIIITTHSPQVLDILNENELGNIIIASYEKEKGTVLKHLEENEITKAKKYMMEGFLSDYWRFSDLEPEKTDV